MQNADHFVQGRLVNVSIILSHILIRVSRHYVYGKCQYNVLSIKILFESKLNLEDNNMQNLGNV